MFIIIVILQPYFNFDHIYLFISPSYFLYLHIFYFTLFVYLF